MTPTRDIGTFCATLEARGPEAALAYLNEAVPHRYSAVYRIDGGMLRNVFLHDKQREARPEFLAVVPFEVSFCQFVLRDGFFRTTDSGADPRLDGHPYQGVMVSYHGVPLTDPAGGLIGTLCHFDVVAHGLADEEFELLQRAARVLPAYLPEPGTTA
ncbi:guanylate cyclase [Variovorax sp. M-6]|uniref:guanylate cyclase n=1 Tax=Variovorax sp. M-6 TaxID=3233041 RepID=UPI003F9A14D0